METLCIQLEGGGAGNGLNWAGDGDGGGEGRRGEEGGRHLCYHLLALPRESIVVGVGGVKGFHKTVDIGTKTEILWSLRCFLDTWGEGLLNRTWKIVKLAPAVALCHHLGPDIGSRLGHSPLPVDVGGVEGGGGEVGLGCHQVEPACGADDWS